MGNFYESLTETMQSGPCVVMTVLEGEEVGKKAGFLRKSRSVSQAGHLWRRACFHSDGTYGKNAWI